MIIHEVFSLHDENLRFWDKIKHNLLTTLDKHMYLPHHTIPPQLQGEVHKCLGTWLQQGIIRAVTKLFMHPIVVIVQQNDRWKFINAHDYQKFNFNYMVRDAFLLPRIDESPTGCLTVVTGFLLLTWHRSTCPTSNGGEGHKKDRS